ncbi:MAG: DNA mismatch repair protein MutS, partial [Spirochaetia bacterium]|nr:DNA mismatch repair protein MutS [Spirochaetia bacterium]
DTYNEDRNLSKHIIERIRSCAARICVNLYPNWNFQRDTAADKLMEHFKVLNLEGFGIADKPAHISAAGALMRYLTETQKTFLHHINKISLDSAAGTLYIDAVSLRNLEIIETGSKEARYATVYSVLDNTQTAMGARELKKWLKSPLADAKLINRRLDTVEFLADAPQVRERITAILSQISDIERISGKLGSQTVNARDLNALKNGIAHAMELEREINTSGNDILKNDYTPRAAALKQTFTLIDSAIAAEPPISVKEGGMIRPDFSPELKELKEASSGGREWLAALQESERKATGISSLKVGYTSVFGYYIEVSKANLKSVPANYIRKQTMVNGERFITPELKEREALILGAQEKMTALEYEIFCGLRESLIKEIPALQEASARIAGLDCLLSLAGAAVSNNYVRPKVDDSEVIEIEEGRHPVVEKSLGFNEFIPNDTVLNRSDEMVMVITGPNMAGKSTYMRQVAVIVLMAQAGSFVPAKSAVIGIVDKIFTRVGAADYLARGQSTFMVEMIETANILNNATRRSLILLDEVGRGTSTFDGVSIAWAITEYIHNKIKARTLFATHYYELTEIAQNLEGVKNYNIEVKEWGEKIIFLRKIVKGSTDRSYGIHVARLAGLPGEVTDRAAMILKDLEKANYTNDGKSKIGTGKQPQAAQPDLFTFEDSELKKALKELQVDEMTPVEALLKLKELKDKYL